MPTIEKTEETPERGIITFHADELSKVIMTDTTEIIVFSDIWPLIREIFNIPDSREIENFFIKKILLDEDSLFLVPIESLEYYISALGENHIAVHLIQ